MRALPQPGNGRTSARADQPHPWDSYHHLGCIGLSELPYCYGLPDRPCGRLMMICLMCFRGFRPRISIGHPADYSAGGGTTAIRVPVGGAIHTDLHRLHPAIAG